MTVMRQDLAETEPSHKRPRLCTLNALWLLQCSWQGHICALADKSVRGHSRPRVSALDHAPQLSSFAMLPPPTKTECRCEAGASQKSAACSPEGVCQYLLPARGLHIAVSERRHDVLPSQTQLLCPAVLPRRLRAVCAAAGALVRPQSLRHLLR